MKKLSEILSGIDFQLIQGSIELEIFDITFDSRQVKAGSLFVALKGTQTDGHKYMQMAVEKGAAAIVCEEIPASIEKNICLVGVKNSHQALGHIASAFYNHPSKQLKLVGITGTNGKTTIATLLYQLFNTLGYKTGLLSTVVNYVGNQEVKATHTTPDSIQINKLLYEMAEVGCEYCFMEVSSHAIHQQRIAGLQYKGGVFTNITHDHLDYHKTFEQYIKVKKQLFDGLQEKSFSLVNKDDKNGCIMLQNTDSKKVFYALKSMADYKAKIIESHFDGMLLNIEGVELWTRFVGEFNAYNLLAVYGSAIELEAGKEEVLTKMSLLNPVSGRFECLKSGDNRIAIIDYAHTPNALLNVIQTINQLRNPFEKLITVVGTGGNRDKIKRPKMGKIAAEKSDKVIFTSDNPRNEIPEDIIADMMGGVDKSLENKVLSIADRKEAIKTAAMLANEGDVILIAGKGHETYQEIKGVKFHFDDKEIIKEQFKMN